MSLATLEDPVALSPICGGKQIFMAGDGFRTAEQQHAPYHKRRSEKSASITLGLEVGVSCK